MSTTPLSPLLLTPADAVALAATHYGLSGVASALPGEYDANFKFVGTNGDVFVLKVLHPSRDLSLITLQVAALDHLARHAPTVPVPQVLSNVRGAPYERVTLPTGSHAYLWMLTWVDGEPLATIRPRHGAVAESVGRALGQLTAGLDGFTHDAARRAFAWDLLTAEWIAGQVEQIADSSKRALVARVMSWYNAQVIPVRDTLRKSVIHGDANDYNVMVRTARATAPAVSGIIDFGDIHWSATVNELAVTAAYALLQSDYPLRDAARVVRGFHAQFPLTEQEIALLFPLIGMRLCVSVVNSARRTNAGDADPYVTVSEQPAWDALEKLAHIAPDFAHYTFRQACGLSAVPQSRHVTAWIAAQSAQAASVFDIPVRDAPQVVIDLSVGSLEFGADPDRLSPAAMGGYINDVMRHTEATLGVGRYDEPRAVYMVPAFSLGPRATDERRTVHMGIDVFADAGTGVCAPIAGTVHAFANRAAAQDYGPVIILRHETNLGFAFFSLYGHLSVTSLASLAVGDVIQPGQRFAWLGDVHENGGWAPHLHFQLMTDLLGLDTGFPGVVPHSARAVWRELCPDPGPLLGVANANASAVAELSEQHALRVARDTRIGRSVKLSYRDPLTIVRGWQQYLYDDTGRAYLDVYNNVPLVGHSHPRVVAAVQQQVALLNTNTRYLHEQLGHYAARLTAHMPASLSVCFIVNSGSEANEVALRLARAHTQRQDIVVLDHAYHGHTSTLIDISPYKFNGPGGRGQPSWVHVAPVPDDYRGAYRRDDAARGDKYASAVLPLLHASAEVGGGVAAYIAESAPSVAGQVMLPPGYLERVYRDVRGAGGVCIADEVQTGFGRLGTHFWGFEMQDVTPDIVVLGKPIGNGFPLAAVVTTADIAASFHNGMEFFSTFGGNPVACAAGLAVLDVLRDEQLPQNARHVGDYFVEQLRALQTQHAIIGDVRGRGLFLGVELVRDRETLEPAGEEASYMANRFRECGVLCGTDGPHHNVLKLRPPLCFTRADVDLFISTFGVLLCEDAVCI